MAKERTKHRDLDSTFELLWGTRQPPSRGPKPSLSVGGIVQAAVEIADADGLDAVSMRRVAEQFGVTTMSLYRYVPSKDDLLELMVDAIAAPAPNLADMPEQWRDGLHWWAHQQFAALRRHPWMTQYAFDHPPMGPNNIQWMECAVQAILKSGLPAEDVIGVLMLITNYTLSETRQQFYLLQAEQATGVSYEDVGRVYARMLEKVVEDGQHPGLAQTITAGAFEGGGPEEDFEYGLTFILDGVEALAVARHRETDQ